MSTIEEEIARERAEEERAEIERRRKAKQKLEREKNRRISNWLRSKQTIPGKGIISGRMSSKQISDQIRAATGRPAKGS
jgi:hypothetical protein